MSAELIIISILSSLVVLGKMYIKYCKSSYEAKIESLKQDVIDLEVIAKNYIDEIDYIKSQSSLDNKISKEKNEIVFDTTSDVFTI